MILASVGMGCHFGGEGWWESGLAGYHYDQIEKPQLSPFSINILLA